MSACYSNEMEVKRERSEYLSVESSLNTSGTSLRSSAVTSGCATVKTFTPASERSATHTHTVNRRRERERERVVRRPFTCFDEIRQLLEDKQEKCRGRQSGVHLNWSFYFKGLAEPQRSANEIQWDTHRAEESSSPHQEHIWYSSHPNPHTAPAISPYSPSRTHTFRRSFLVQVTAELWIWLLVKVIYMLRKTESKVKIWDFSSVKPWNEQGF